MGALLGKGVSAGSAPWVGEAVDRERDARGDPSGRGRVENAVCCFETRRADACRVFVGNDGWWDMAQQNLSARQSALVGVTLFSMFFGAGNLILPPLLGFQAGEATVPAALGFLVAAIGLPVLGIVVVALAGTVRDLAARVHPLFARIFVAAVYLAIGPCLAIPRTSSTAFEMLAPLLPAHIPIETASIVFSVAFFAAAYVLAMHPGRLTNLLGRITGPALIALIVAVTGAALLSPVPEVGPAVAPYTDGAAVQGFLVGYQTMDLLASLTFGLVIATNIREMGVTDPGGLTREISRAGVVAGVLMALIYCGLAFVGVGARTIAPDATNGAAILTASATAHFGTVGTVVVAAIFLLACLNVCTGLISCCGTYFADELPRVSYRACAVAFAVFSCVLSNFGLDTILAFSVPLLGAMYPVAIVLVLMGLAHGLSDRYRLMWPSVVAVTAVVSVSDALRAAFAPTLWLPIDALPLAGLDLAWVVPALCAALISYLVSRSLNARAAA